VPATAGLLRRLGAALYDGLLLLAIVMVATAALLPLTGGVAITRASAGLVYEYLYRLALASVAGGYLCLCWLRVGQTLGMKAWRIRLERQDGGRLRPADALRRLAIVGALYLLAAAGVLGAVARQIPGLLGLVCAAPLLLSYLWLLVDRHGDTLHDRASVTRVRRVAPEPRAISAS